MCGALVVGLTVALWPGSPPEEMPVVFDTDRELVPIELVEIPQTTAPPPPADMTPPPPPPVDLEIPPVEVEDLIEVEDLEVTEFEIETSVPTTNAPAPPAPRAPPRAPGPPRGTPGPSRTGEDRGPVLVRNPDVLPRNRMVRLPAYPDAARRAGVEGRAVVEILVTEGGRVDSYEILERYVVRGDRREPVAELPYGMEASVVDAIVRRVYSPARHDGRIVRTITRETIIIGV